MKAFSAASSNTFGWRGAGRLDIDAGGVQVTVGRNLATLLLRRRSRRIPADHILGVYREGDALRIDVSGDRNARVVLAFSARNRESAARIVQLLPTSRTVEIEEGPANAVAKSSSATPWAAMGLALAVIGIAVLWMSRRQPQVADDLTSGSLPAPAVRTPRGSDAAGGVPASATTPPSPDSMPSLLDTPVRSGDEPAPLPQVDSTSAPRAADAPVTEPAPPPRRAPDSAAAPSTVSTSDVDGFVPDPVPPIYVQPEEVVVSIPQRTLAYDTARGILSRFESGATELSEALREERARADSGRRDLASYADDLEALAARWREMGTRLLDTREAQDPALAGFRASLLAVVIYQGSFLAGYAEAVRARDVNGVMRAFEDQARADRALERARAYLR